ncbi:hypothetical protein Thi970DRAFT_02591 [Thiorhodovibrio frisius]|uniref:Uncharacterized protein n=1 Tax=Thiorhodovibrio frisius TaxID=631362 RepID=H8Z0J6_9GAMM|nr:hypothetical protein Thi970DRAFT_02591 [Thiorhodovibrio frisius]WPL24634.1 hypothetical protein Thiofri_04854 [Thiorhodovibrio frisius]
MALNLSAKTEPVPVFCRRVGLPLAAECGLLVGC